MSPFRTSAPVLPIEVGRTGGPQLEPIALATTSVAKRYGRGRWVLSGVDLSVPAGSITGLLGPNAVGKSTLIKMWLGYERPSAGATSVMGVDPQKHRAQALRHLAYVAQRPALYPRLTVRDHLWLGAHLRPGFDLAGATERATGPLALPAEARVGQLSGGQQAQLALALALGTGASVLLLDEPLASLDPIARREFLDILARGVRADGRTALLSSHVVTDIAQVCDQIIVLGVGRVLLSGRRPELEAEHRTAHAPPPVPDDVAVTLVGSFLDAAGRPSALYRVEPDTDLPGLAAAGLEDIVLGYLTAARTAGEQRAHA